MTYKKEEERVQKDLMFWKYLGLCPVIVPIIFFHGIKWLIIGGIDIYQLLMDFLFMGFSIAMSAFEVMINHPVSQKDETVIFPKKYMTVAGGVLFLFLNIVYQCLEEKNMINCVRFIILVIISILNIAFIYYTYQSGKYAIEKGIKDNN